MLKEITLPKGKVKLIIPDDLEGANELTDETVFELNEKETDEDIEELMSRIPDRDKKDVDDCVFPADFAIQFKCADCCKKVLFFGDCFDLTVDFIKGFARIITKDGRFILETFNDGKLVEKQVMDNIFIFNPCSIEFLVIEKDPKVALNPGLSKFAVEFECGVCCKKVLNIKKFFPFPPVILVPPRNEFLLVKTFNAGKLIKLQCVKLMLINPKLVCDIERNALEIDP